MAVEKKKIQYMCRYCGKCATRLSSAGRPLPGICPRKANKGPHTWIINKKY